MNSLRLVGDDGEAYQWQPSGAVAPLPTRQFRSRIAYAAAHVVADLTDPHSLDWEATLSFRHHLWRFGFGVAEAMDTAQRGAGLDWHLARELIVRTAREAAASGGEAVYGVATDQLPAQPATLDRIRAAYLEQLEVVEQVGGTAIVMASRSLVGAARSSDDYLSVYQSVVDEASRPVLIHWLGEAFDPALAGYWGSADPWAAVEILLDLARANASRIDGIKISLLDDKLELSLRRRLPPGVRIYTGDDFNFMEMILGDDEGHSEALLGVLDPIAPVAAQALVSLDEDDADGFRTWLAPTVPFSRHLFSAPTYNYKTGITFLAYLNGHQDHFRMLGSAELDRSLPHLCRLLVLADRASLLNDPDLAVARMSPLIA